MLSRAVVSGRPALATLVSVCALLVALALIATPAFAAAPEAPEALPPSKINATSATLNGVINPHHEGEPGFYSFVYAKSPSVCTEGAGTLEEHTSGSSPQTISITADSLQPDTTYTFCLKATNTLGEATLSPPLTFTTTSLPEMRTVEPVTNITGTTAILHGVLDPKAASPEAQVEYDFFYVYAGGESTCSEPFVVKPVPQSPGVASGTMGQAVEAPLSGLTPDTEYAVCLGSRNAGEAFNFEALSAPVTFKSAALAPDVISESVSERWATAVLLETQINNEAEPTECFFQYGEASVSEHEVSCGGADRYEELALSAKVEGLTAGHTYHWRTVAKSKAGTTDGQEESFTTAVTPEPPELSIANFAWSPWVGVAMTAPANAGSEPEALFDWGACPTAGYCAGAGSYKDENGNEEAMAATRINGSWGQAVEIALPPGAARSGQKAGFGLAQPSVACTEPGDCVAVGHYLKEGGSKEAMVVTEAGGEWGTASEIKPPPNAASNPEASLGSLACPAAGSCVARGEYTDEDGDREAMVAEETGGAWGPASEIELPTNAESKSRSYLLRSNLRAVACSAAGSCVGIGEYRDSSTMTQEAMVAAETGGRWAQASQIVLPANAGSRPESRLDSVVCVPSGPCVADGSYIDRSGDREAMVAEETGGAWGPASQIQAPANVAVKPEIGFGLAPLPIACAASGSCVITAEYTDSSGGEQAMVADETNGVWGPAREIAAPANAAANPRTVLVPSCTASGACVVAGEYTDAEEDREVMVADETNGSWSPAREIAAPANAATNPEIIFGEVQCPPVGSCVAFGEYTNHTGVTRDMEVNGLQAPENTAAPIVSGTAEVAQTLTCSQGTWIAASPTSYAYRWLRDGAAIGGAESNTYTVTAADEGHSISCEVTATNAVGSKSAVSANGDAIREEARERREAEETAATKRRQEETLAKKQEEAKIAIAGRVSLTGSVLGIQSGGKGSVKLTCTGTAMCAGKLTLTVKRKGKKRKKAEAETIAKAAFSIPAGKTGVVTIKLTAAGRTLLKASHGKLSATLTIIKSSPAPAGTKRESVLLVQRTAKAK